MNIIDKIRNISTRRKNLYNEISRIHFDYRSSDFKSLKDNNINTLNDLITICNLNIKHVDTWDDTENFETKVAKNMMKKVKSSSVPYFQDIKSHSEKLIKFFNSLDENNLTKESLDNFADTCKELRFKFFEISRKHFFTSFGARLGYKPTRKYLRDLGYELNFVKSKCDSILCCKLIKNFYNTLLSQEHKKLTIYIPDIAKDNYKIFKLDLDNSEHYKKDKTLKELLDELNLYKCRVDAGSKAEINNCYNTLREYLYSNKG